MRRYLIDRIHVASLALVLALAVSCGSSSSTSDPGGSPDVWEDAATDPGPAPDAVQDATQDADLHAATDIATDTPPADTGTDESGLPDEGVADLPGQDAGPDVPAEYPWAAGCEPPGTGAVWIVPGPDAVEPETQEADASETQEADAPADPFLRRPYIQMSDRDTVTIVWRMAQPTELQGCVEVAWDQESRTVCGAPDANAQYEIRIDALPPAREINYAVAVGDDRVPTTTFRTMPDRPTPMKFAMFADAHNTQENLRRFSQVALAEGIDFAISVGDQAGSGQPWEYDIYFRGLTDLASRVNVWAVLGNHDEKNLPGYFDAFVLPQGNVAEIDKGWGEGWWDARIGNVWLGGGWVRDFYVSMPDSEWGEVGWFRERFQSRAFQTAQWKLFFIHQPPYVLQWNDACDYDGEDCLKVALVPLMAEFGIQASFHGHMHGIEYGEVEDGVWTFVAGGLGGSLDDDQCIAPQDFPSPWFTHYLVHNFTIVEADCDRLTVRYMDLDGNELIRVVIDEDGKLLEHSRWVDR